MDESDAPSVLVIEDEPDLGRLYELWLEDDYDVRHVETGEQALSALDDTVDVVLLDRRLPGMSGRAVLEEIRERDVDCRVAMVTAVDPSFDVVEMGFDTYVTKPPDREELRDVVERLLDRATLDEQMQEYYSLVSRRAALETEFSSAELADREAYAVLVERIERQRAVVDESLGDVGSHDAFVDSVREVLGPGDGDAVGDTD